MERLVFTQQHNMTVAEMCMFAFDPHDLKIIGEFKPSLSMIEILMNKKFLESIVPTELMTSTLAVICNAIYQPSKMVEHPVDFIYDMYLVTKESPF
jgi:hypothetical protein